MNNLKALSKLTATDSLRPVLTGVFVKDGRAYATNGFIMGVTECGLPITGIIPAKVAGAGSMWNDTLTNSDDVITLLDVKGKMITDYKIKGNFPDCEQLIKDRAVKKVKHTITLGLHTLEPLVQALKATSTSKYAAAITLELPEDSNAMITGRVMGNDSLVIYLMPVNGGTK